MDLPRAGSGFWLDATPGASSSALIGLEPFNLLSGILSENKAMRVSTPLVAKTIITGIWLPVFTENG